MIAAEITRHHRVIERWLAGTAGEGEFARFAHAHGPAFTMVTPDGRVLTRERVLAEVEAAYGTAPGLAIEIRGARVVAEDGALAVAVYEEWQGGRGRRSTAVLQVGGGDPVWLHLQETWIGDRAP